MAFENDFKLFPFHSVGILIFDFTRPDKLSFFKGIKFDPLKIFVQFLKIHFLSVIFSIRFSKMLIHLKNEKLRFNTSNLTMRNKDIVIEDN